MHLEIAPYLMLGSVIAICIFSIIQCYIYKIEDLKNYSKPSKTLFGLLIATIIYSLTATIAGHLNQVFFPDVSETRDRTHVVYNNQINADVEYVDEKGYIYNGGEQPTDSSSIANWFKNDKELTVTKGTESISKTIDEDEIVGDKNGIVTKIEFGTRKHTYRPLGLPVLTTEKSFVKVHLKPKNPVDKKAIENLLDGKKLNRKDAKECTPY